MRLPYLLCLAFISQVSFAQVYSPFIHVDQFGYLPDDDKVAVISDPQIGFNSDSNFTPSNTLQVIDEASGNVVFEGEPNSWNGGVTHNLSGDKGWWFDFSNISDPGTYHIYDPVNDEQSASFKINTDVYYGVLKAASRMFFYNRCGFEKTSEFVPAEYADGMSFNNPLQDAECRYYLDPENESLEKDLSGGWFDAGDYNKYVTFATEPMHLLLSAYEDNPSVFADDWGIPESGNSIPDIIDELKWELDWLRKMNNDDGSTHIKMGSISHSENVASPPSDNTDRRYYGPTCTSAEIVIAGIFAHASHVMAEIEGLEDFAAILATEAQTTWNYVLPKINSGDFDEECDDGTIKAGDADMDAAKQKAHAVSSAAYLFQVTNEASHNDYVANNLNDTEPIATGFWGPYDLSIKDALSMYSSLPNATAAAKQTIIASATQEVSNNYNDLFEFSPDDLYRTAMPEWAYHWGSNMPKANLGNMNMLMQKNGLSGIDTESARKAALEHLHYFNGVNPLGMVQLSNMYELGAENSVNEIYHTWFADGTPFDHALTSEFGPPPGFVTGGANKDFSLNITPPAGQPAMKSYLDFNDNWPNNSWEISEPAIYYQAAFIRLVSYFADPQSSVVLPVSISEFYVNESDCENRLTWTTSSESENDYFEIQKRNANGEFETIGKVQGAGNSLRSHTYSFLDKTRSKNPVYRLKQVDFNGSFTYSKKISIAKKSCGEIAEILLSPNPASTNLNIEISSKNYSGPIQIECFDALGQLLKSTTIELNARSTNESWNIVDLQSGMYYLVSSFSNGQKIQTKFTKVD